MNKILCFPNSVRNSSRYRAFWKEYKERDLGKDETKELRTELLKKYKIKPPHYYCNKRCPYKTQCQKENLEMRYAFLDTMIEFVWMPRDRLTKYEKRIQEKNQATETGY